MRDSRFQSTINGGYFTCAPPIPQIPSAPPPPKEFSHFTLGHCAHTRKQIPNGQSVLLLLLRMVPVIAQTLRSVWCPLMKVIRGEPQYFALHVQKSGGWCTSWGFWFGWVGQMGRFAHVGLSAVGSVCLRNVEFIWAANGSNLTGPVLHKLHLCKACECTLLWMPGLERPSTCKGGLIAGHCFLCMPLLLCSLGGCGTATRRLMSMEIVETG